MKILFFFFFLIHFIHTHPQKDSLFRCLCMVLKDSFGSVWMKICFISSCFVFFVLWLIVVEKRQHYHHHRIREIRITTTTEKKGYLVFFSVFFSKMIKTVVCLKGDVHQRKTTRKNRIYFLVFLHHKASCVCVNSSKIRNKK